MKPSNPQKRFYLVLLVMVLAWVASACAPTRIGVSWGALSEVELYGQKGVMVAYNQYLLVLDPATGTPVALRDSEGRERIDENGNRRLWVVEGSVAENAQFFASPSLIEENGETVFLTPAFNNRLLKVASSTARIDDPKGSPVEGAIITSMTEDDTHYYVAFKLGDVVALDKETLTPSWQYDTEKGIWAQPLLVDGTLYVTSIDHTLNALDAKTGEPKWAKAVDLGGVVASVPLFHEGFLYVGSYSHKLYKVSLEGQIVAEYTANNWIWSTPTLFDGVLYVSDLAGYVHAVNPTTMERIWAVKHAERGIRPAPLVTEKFVVVASRDGRVYWLDRKDGTLVFNREIEGRPEVLSDLLLVTANPEQGLIEDVVVVSTVQMSHFVVAYALENGRAMWVYAR